MTHCAHCADDCAGWESNTGFTIHENERHTARWVGGHCPACTEAERIHRDIHDAAARFPHTDWYEAYMHAARIAIFPAQKGRYIQ